MELNTTENDIVNAVRTFGKMYKPVHGYLAATLCVFAITTNILNVIVLTRKNVTCAVEIFLTGLAISYGLTMTLYLPYLLQMYLMHGTTESPKRNTEGAARYQMIFAVTSIITHSISIWLTVTLAVFRYLFIRFPRKGLRFGTTKSSVAMVIVVVVVVNIFCIPNSIVYQLKSTRMSVNDTGYSYNITVWRMYQRKDVILQNINYWLYAMFTKLLPCFLLMTFSVLLIRVMKRADKRRNKMTVNNTFSLRTKRTAKMLLGVVILSVVTETPHGILVLLSGLIPDFFDNFYIPLGDLMDILSMINHAVNFVLYCTMSEKFRNDFLCLFCRCVTKNETRQNRYQSRNSIYVINDNPRNL